MSFDRVARVYRLLELLTFGGALQRARVAQLDFDGAPRVLVLGDGDGRFLQSLLERVPSAAVDVVEASANMIELARRRVPDEAAVVFYQARIEDFEPQGDYDYVVSHFFLDCFERSGIELIVEKIAGCLGRSGAWLVSDFQMPENGTVRRIRARVLLWSMYRFFRLAAKIEARKLADPAPILADRGFELARRQVSNFGFVRADRWVQGQDLTSQAGQGR